MEKNIIIGIETSCDETAVAILKNGQEVLADFVASQVDIHREYGGVVPEIACRAHMEYILPGIKNSLAVAKVSPQDIDAVAVTNRPGLIGALLIGVATAKSLSAAWGKPLLAVNHIEAHIAAAKLSNPEIEYPFTALVVSGGHTNIYLVSKSEEGKETYQCVAQTLDDAAGEAFDKAAKILGLGFPGGPAIDKVAKQVDSSSYNWKNNCLPPDGINFSFSGLKTAVLYAARGKAGRKGELQLSDQQVKEAAWSFQEAVVNALVKRTIAAATKYRTKYITIGGGVAANSCLRKKMQEETSKYNLKIAIPPINLCTDNAVMIAKRGYELYQRGEFSTLDLEAIARGEV